MCSKAACMCDMKHHNELPHPHDSDDVHYKGVWRLTFFTEASNRNTRLLSAHDEVGMVLCHGVIILIIIIYAIDEILRLMTIGGAFVWFVGWLGRCGAGLVRLFSWCVSRGLVCPTTASP